MQKSTHKYLLIFLLSLFSGCCFASRDSSVFTYWRNGKAKTQTIYKVKYGKDTERTTVLKLKKKKINYFDRTGTRISKRDFHYFYKDYMEVDSSEYIDFFANEKSIMRKMDSLEQRFKNSNTFRPEIIRLKLGDSTLNNSFTMILPLRNDKDRTYKERDTLIEGNKYALLLFAADTVLKKQSKISTKLLTGALRVDHFKIYYFDAHKRTETLTLDLEAFAIKKTKNDYSVFEAYAQLTKEARDGINTGASKTLAFGLASLIFLFR